MGRFAQELLGAVDVRCRLDLPVEVPAWPLTAETRHNLFLAFKETLNNAVKHAAASEVRISLELTPHPFALVVRDNGHGFDLAHAHPTEPDRLTGGNGLVNMKERLARIGGRCEIASDQGAGTVVSLIVVFTGQAPVRPTSPSSNARTAV